MNPGDVVKIVLSWETLDLHKHMGNERPWFDGAMGELIRETANGMWEIKLDERKGFSKSQFLFFHQRDFIALKRKGTE